MRDDWILIPADRTDAEKSEAYGVEWRTPANEPTARDYLRRLFGGA